MFVMRKGKTNDPGMRGELLEQARKEGTLHPKK